LITAVSISKTGETMTLPLVSQLQFARSEFMRGLSDLDPSEALRRVEPLNCLSWMIGHMASQEQAFWLLIAQGKTLYPDLHRRVGTGYPASTPPLDEMIAAWKDITTAADDFLNTLTTSKAVEYLQWKGKPYPESIGTLLQRNIYHYWLHTGEAHAVRSMLGHTNLPDFVGAMDNYPYRPDTTV
jgi:uncharacterized damage-inducible protein DinB